ncbi:MAG TPA: c-type cytochrome [Gemmatimonadaceae bacterium]|nr:c-type cytochrome [Gemmatimonadaceae bacterium]
MRGTGRTRVIGSFGAAVAAVALGACRIQDAATRTDTSAAVTPAGRSAGRAWNPDTWQAPAVDSTPDDPFEVAAYRGLAILTHTRDSLPEYDGGSLNCTSCHLEEGRRQNAAPLVGAMARYPRYMDRSGAVVPIEDRVNYCFTRSLAGSKLPNDSREMQDIVAYLALISRGVPTGEHVRGEGLAKMPDGLAGDSARGSAIYLDNCARCHGTSGAGMGPIPALWGATSFSIGASMARPERAASFIRHNMPFDRPGTLTDQQAFDVATYVASMTRPDSPGKEKDWPNGGAPADVPYATKGHVAAHSPPLIARTKNPYSAIVPPPVSVVRDR